MIRLYLLQLILVLCVLACSSLVLAVPLPKGGGHGGGGSGGHGSSGTRGSKAGGTDGGGGSGGGKVDKRALIIIFSILGGIGALIIACCVRVHTHKHRQTRQAAEKKAASIPKVEGQPPPYTESPNEKAPKGLINSWWKRPKPQRPAAPSSDALPPTTPVPASPSAAPSTPSPSLTSPSPAHMQLPVPSSSVELPLNNRPKTAPFKVF